MAAVSVPPPCSYLNDNGATDPASAVGNKGADLLIVNITDTRNLVKSLGLSIPIGNSDAGSYFNTKVLEAVDYGVRFGPRPFFVLADVRVTDGQCSPVVCQYYCPSWATMDVGLFPADRRRRCEHAVKQARYVNCRGWLANGERCLLSNGLH
jgi:hypothetical protein